jgi:hypothetical protein
MSRIGLPRRRRPTELFRQQCSLLTCLLHVHSLAIRCGNQYPPVGGQLFASAPSLSTRHIRTDRQEVTRVRVHVPFLGTRELRRSFSVREPCSIVNELRSLQYGRRDNVHDISMSDRASDANGPRIASDVPKDVHCGTSPCKNPTACFTSETFDVSAMEFAYAYRCG